MELLNEIAAGEMAKAGVCFGRTENDVWCTEEVPAGYIVERLYEI